MTFNEFLDTLSRVVWQRGPLEDVPTRALSKEDAYAPGR